MTKMTRAESLEMWKLIANGILSDEGSTDEHGEPIPAAGHHSAYAFIEKVAIAVLRADLEKPTSRGDALIQALGLGGTLNEDEYAMRTTWMLTNVFPNYNSVGEEVNLNPTQKMQEAIKIYRRLLGYSAKEPDQETDIQRKRQLVNFAKKMGINQDTK